MILPLTNDDVTHQLGTALQKIGVNVVVEYSGSAPHGFVFTELNSGNRAKLTLLELNEQLDKLYKDNNSPHAHDSGVIAWINSFREFLIPGAQSIGATPIVATISQATATQLPFARLIENAEHMEQLKPVHWDLTVKNMHGVANALRHIAVMEGNTDLHFAADKSGKINYSSTAKITRDELDIKVRKMLEHMIATDPLLTQNGALTDKGHAVIDQMLAHSDKDQSHYLAFTKGTRLGPDYLVDVVENAQIAMAAQQYLNFRNVQVANENGFDTQRPTGIVHEEDGRDTYSYENRNLTSVNKSHLGERNDMAAIPNLTTKDAGATNLVSAQSEDYLKNILDMMVGALPIELSQEQDHAPTAPPKVVKPGQQHIHKGK